MDLLKELSKKKRGGGVLGGLLGINTEDIDRLKNNMEKLIKSVEKLTKEIEKLNKNLEKLLGDRRG